MLHVHVAGPFEPRHEKICFLNMRKKAQTLSADQLRDNRAADQRLCFRFIDRIQSLYFLNLAIFQASSYLPWLLSPVCLQPGRKPRRQVFSRLYSPVCVQPGRKPRRQIFSRLRFNYPRARHVLSFKRFGHENSSSSADSRRAVAS